MPPVIATLYAGVPEILDDRGTLSAIRKVPVPGPWEITREGLVRDQQANRLHHGGPEKALHHYPQDHYPAWKAELPHIASHFEPASFGENLSTLGMTESDVCIGDIFRVGGVVLQVGQGRQPCFKLNARFGDKRMALLVQKTGRTGWYYRILEPGTIEEGNSIELVERPRPEWTLERITQLLYVKTLAFEELRALAAIPELAKSWRKLALGRIASGEVESWQSRLEGA